MHYILVNSAFPHFFFYYQAHQLDKNHPFPYVAAATVYMRAGDEVHFIYIVVHFIYTLIYIYKVHFIYILIYIYIRYTLYIYLYIYIRTRVYIRTLYIYIRTRV
jgi:hypothetical protein